MSLGEAAIARVAAGFLDRTLAKAEWTHEAHFATTLWLLRHRPEWRLAHDLPPLIRAYNVATGGVNDESQGYHETITQASLRAAHATLAVTDGAPLERVLAALMASPLGRSDWPFAHWTRDRLLAPEARRAWREPDLAPLPYPPLA